MFVKAKKNQYNVQIETYQKDMEYLTRKFSTNYDVQKGSEIIFQETARERKIYVVKEVLGNSPISYNKKIIDAYNDIDFDVFNIESDERYFYKVCIGDRLVNAYAKVDLPLNTIVITDLGEGRIISIGNFKPETSIIVAYNLTPPNNIRKIVYSDGIVTESFQEAKKMSRIYAKNSNYICIDYGNLEIDDNYPFAEEDFYAVNYLINRIRIGEYSDKHKGVLEKYLTAVGEHEKLKYFQNNHN